MRVFEGDLSFCRPMSACLWVSKALFEAWSVNLAARSKGELDRLVEQKTQVRSAFIDLMNSDPEFEISISSSTGTPRRVVKRFSAIEQLIEKALQ